MNTTRAIDVPQTVGPQATTARRNRNRSLAALVLGAIAIGFGPIFVRFSEVGPSSTAFWRLAMALPAMVLWVGMSKPAAGRHGKAGWVLVALAGLFFATDLALWHWAITLTTVANATLEANLTAVLVPIIAWVLFRQRVSRQFLVALVLAVAGTALLVGKNAHISADTLRGDALGVLTAVFYSGYLLCVKAARDRGIDTARIMLMSGAISAAILLPVTLISGEALLAATAFGWLVLVALGLVSQFAGQSLITYAMAELPASGASLGLLIQPATATIAAWALLGESLAPGQLAGGLILLLGLWLAKRDA